MVLDSRVGYAPASSVAELVRDTVAEAPAIPFVNAQWAGAVVQGLRTLLDLVIVTYALGLFSTVLIGGIDLFVVSFHHPGKLIIALVVLVPIRVALGGRSRVGEVTHAIPEQIGRVWMRVGRSMPPAVTDTLVALAIVRLASVAVAFFANLVFGQAINRGFALPFSNAKFVETFTAWDSGWYWDIATRGYYFRPDAQSSIAFFPLYPMLMRAAAAPFGGGAHATWIAGIVVATLASIAALIAIHRLTERLSGSRETARRTVLYIVVFPWSIFLSRVYSESVFLLTSALAISGAYHRRWWRAGLWGALATLTRPNGILIALPLALLAVRHIRSGRQVADTAIALSPIPVAFAAFCGYVYLETGDLLGWMAAQEHWGYSLGHEPWQQLQRVIGSFVTQGPYDYFLSSDVALFELLQAVTALTFIALVPAVFKRLGIAMGMYVLVSLLVPLSSNALEGIGRYVSVLFPVFMVVAARTTPVTHEALVAVSLVFRTLLVCFFVTWQPVY
jgi:hypothetical protein